MWHVLFSCPVSAQILCFYYFKAFSKTVSKEHVLSDILPTYRKLAADDQDSVRLLTVEDLITIASQLDHSEVKQELLTQLRQAASDKSWRVRYMVASEFVKVGVPSVWIDIYEFYYLTAC